MVVIDTSEVSSDMPPGSTGRRFIGPSSARTTGISSMSRLVRPQPHQATAAPIAKAVSAPSAVDRVATPPRE
jgi:hypothetical protein